jgi:hypothetical protein
LGHIVGNDGIYVDLKKIEATKDWTHPKDIESLRGFLGLTRYYHNFFQKYGKIHVPSLLPLKRMLSIGLQPLINPSKPQKRLCVRFLF